MDGVGGLNFLGDGGELGRLIRAKDWLRTPIGAPEGWPQSLRTAVSLCLASNFRDQSGGIGGLKRGRCQFVRDRAPPRLHEVARSAGA
jgi:hypothetical protein